MRLAAATVITALLATLPVHAEVLVAEEDNLPNDATLKLSLPQGEVDITMNTVEGYGLFIHAGGSYEVLIDDSAYMPRLLKTHGNSALLELNTGGNACPILFAWITYDAEGLRGSDTFGTCAEQAEFEDSGLGPVVIMDDIANPGQRIAYAYDEVAGALTETVQ